MDLSPIESPTSSGLSSPHEAYVPPTKLRVDSVPDPKPSEPPSLSLDTYLPLGSINIKLADPKNAIEAISWVEAEDFLPFTNISQTFNLSLAALWRAQWIRVLRLPLAEQYEEAWRIYVLPDDEARSVVDRSKGALRKHLEEVLALLDVSPRAWGSPARLDTHQGFDRWAAADFTSLYYLFNTLPSPNPTSEGISDRYSRAIMEGLLDPTAPPAGLLTKLYPYQRRSVAECFRRETAPQLQLDPRLEERKAPDGPSYYYNARDRLFLRHARKYDSVRGGILAETMGLGKTVICLALILSTRGHWPRAPPQYQKSQTPVKPTVARLTDMAGATIARYSLPWRQFFDSVRAEEGLDMAECISTMEKQEPHYEIPPVVVRSHRYSNVSTPPERIRLCSCTLVVVPKNLVHQWKAELKKHVEENALKVLVMEDRHKPIPPPNELATYDLILFSRPRFEVEGKSTEDLYESPLKSLHFLRIIIDEGHGISSSSSNASVVAERLVRAERRWVVTGTPAKDLMGVEVEVSSMTHGSDAAFRQQSLEQRKAFNMYQEESSGALKALGQLASRFLKAQPWALSSSPFEQGDSAKWEDYIYRHESLTFKTFSGFSLCLQRVLENLVVKTRPEDVERDIELPPLTHKIVRLEPSFFDKVTANLFVLLILSNAVTSERQDMDYLFHRNSQHHLHRLISSLRQSGFYWTGIDESSVRKSLDVTYRYLAKDDVMVSDEDRKLIEDTAAAASTALDNPIWRSLTQTSEMGVTVKDWPEGSGEAWAFADCVDPMATGLGYILHAQKHVNDKLAEENPLDDFESAAAQTKADAVVNSAVDRQQTVYVPNVVGEPSTNQASTGRLGASAKSKSPKKPSHKSARPVQQTGATGATAIPNLQEAQSQAADPQAQPSQTLTEQASTSLTQEPTNTTPTKSKKRSAKPDRTIELQSDQPLARACLAGTTSRKFSYLLSRIVSLHATEKILIFYDANFIAYYLSEALDLLHIKYLLYTSDISNERRGKHLVLFNDDDTQRVMLMDIKQAAHGLNVSTASRVFFVNPVCRPNIEAQAIKRAHRIGQTMPVHVETLVLKGTVEEAMHDRAAKMTSHEHLRAKTIEDDLGVARIIQGARVLPFSEEELRPENQMAPLEVPQQIFGRPGRGGKVGKMEKEVFGEEGEDGEMVEGGQKGKKRRKTAGAMGESKVSKTGRSTGKGKAKEKKTVKIKMEPVDDPIPWDPVRDEDWGPGTAPASGAGPSQSSIFGGS